MARITEVRGRDGRLVPFESERIESSIRRAIADAALLDSPLARELSHAVGHFLRTAHANPVDAGEIVEMVEKVLRETGHRDIALAYASGRARSSAADEPRGAIAPAAPMFPSKATIERLLFRGGEPAHGLSPESPVEVAAALGSRMLGEYLLEEVFPDPVREAHRAGDLHLHDLDSPLRLLRTRIDAARIPAGSRAGFFGELLAEARRLLPFTSEAIEVHGLPVGVALHAKEQGVAVGEAAAELRATIARIENLAALDPRPAARFAFEIPFLPCSTREENAGDLFQDPHDPLDTTLRFLEGFESAARALPVERGLEPRPHPDRATARFELVLSEETFRERRLAGALERLLGILPPAADLGFRIESGSAVTDESARDAVPAVAGKVTLDLPRIALAMVRAGEREPGPRLEHVVRVACRAARARASFLASLRLAGGAEPPGFAHRGGARSTGRPAHAIGVLGLAEAVRVVTGRSLGDGGEGASQGKAWLESIDRALSAARRSGDPPIHVEESASDGALRRFAALDRARFAEEWREHLGRLDGDRAYTSGVRLPEGDLADPRERGRRIARFRGLVRAAAALDGIAALRARGASAVVSFLEEVTRAAAEASPESGNQG